MFGGFSGGMLENVRRPVAIEAAVMQEETTELKLRQLIDQFKISLMEE